MKTIKVLFLIITLFFIYSCNNNVKEKPELESEFKTELITIKSLRFSEHTVANALSNLRLKPNDERYGSVRGDGVFGIGSEVKIAAYPKRGYRFLNWESDGKIVFKNQFQSFIIKEDMHLVANFRPTFITKLKNWLSSSDDSEEPSNDIIESTLYEYYLNLDYYNVNQNILKFYAENLTIGSHDYKMGIDPDMGFGLSQGVGDINDGDFIMSFEAQDLNKNILLVGNYTIKNLHIITFVTDEFEGYDGDKEYQVKAKLYLKDENEVLTEIGESQLSDVIYKGDIPDFNNPQLINDLIITLDSITPIPENGTFMIKIFGYVHSGETPTEIVYMINYGVESYLEYSINEWDDWDMYYMMNNEAFLPIYQVVEYLNKPQDEVISKYINIRSYLDENVVFDVLFAPEGVDMFDVMFIEHTLDDYEYYDMTYINANLGDVLKVNVRALSDEFASINEIGFFHSGGAVNGVFGTFGNILYNGGNDIWGSLTTEITNIGHTQIGITASDYSWSKPLLIIVEE